MPANRIAGHVTKLAIPLKYNNSETCAGANIVKW